MRLTKGKINKLLKKRNQSKKNKRPLKRLQLNKTLKPKRKLFDISKKTFKNRQMYGGTNNQKNTELKELEEKHIVNNLKNIFNKSRGQPPANPANPAPPAPAPAPPSEPAPAPAPAPAPPSAPAPAPPSEPIVNNFTSNGYSCELVTLKTFLSNIEQNLYNNQLTTNIVNYINIYQDYMNTQDYFYDETVGEYKVSYIYTKNADNLTKNIYFIMFYYKNNKGNMKNILQCLFIYNTIILDEMSSYIQELSAHTLKTEFNNPLGVGDNNKYILFYDNSTKFINKDNQLNKSSIIIENDQDIRDTNKLSEYAKTPNGFIYNETNNNYTYILYYLGTLDIDNLNTIMTTTIIKIIKSKISN